jgi:hypothetical protein
MGSPYCLTELRHRQGRRLCRSASWEEEACALTGSGETQLDRCRRCFGELGDWCRGQSDASRGWQRAPAARDAEAPVRQLREAGNGAEEWRDCDWFRRQNDDGGAHASVVLVTENDGTRRSGRTCAIEGSGEAVVGPARRTPQAGGGLLAGEKEEAALKLSTHAAHDAL